MLFGHRVFLAASASLAGALRGHRSSSADDASPSPNLSNPSTLPRDSTVDSIGNTPLIYLRSVSEATGCHIYAKAEWMNPTGSIKDRAAKVLLEDAERRGLIKPGDTIVEGTGGNTGIALAQIGRAKGYKVILCMPKIISEEKINYQRKLGAQVYLQPLVPFANPENYARKAATIAEEVGGFHTNQFENLSNFRAHYSGTGPEIWRQTKGRVDCFVTSAGTGGTIAGISSFLKEMNPDIRTYLIDPHGSALYDYWFEKKLTTHGNSMIEGIGIGRITNNFSAAKIDHAFRGSDREAVEMAYYLLREEGLFVGPSAALNVVGAVKAARRLGPGKVVVTILCDSGERYMSKLYNDEFLRKEGLVPEDRHRESKLVEFVE